MINFLAITPHMILFAAITLLVLYLSALFFLIRNKSGYIPFIILIFFPVVGPLAIVLKNIIYRKNNITNC